MVKNHWEDKLRAALQEGEAGITVEIHPGERSVIPGKTKKKKEEIVEHQVKNRAGENGTNLTWKSS